MTTVQTLADVAQGIGGQGVTQGAFEPPPPQPTVTPSFLADLAQDAATGTEVALIDRNGGVGTGSWSIVTNVPGDLLELETVDADTQRLETNASVAGLTPATYPVVVRYAEAPYADADVPIIVSVTASGGASAGTLAEVVLTNWATGAVSSARWSGGHLFARGAIAAAQTVGARRKSDGTEVTCALDGPASWDDGSLAYGALHIVDDTGDVAASGARTYELFAKTASRTPTASGFDPWAWLTANTDLNVELTGMATSAGAAMSPATRTISLNTAIGVTTRRRRYLDHARVQVLKVWGMASSDGHLKGEWYITILREAGGAVEGVWVECVVAQDWYVADPGFGAGAETKDKRQYFATLKNGVTTLQAYYGDLAQTAKIQHPYHAAWSTVQRSGSSKGLPFWIAGTKAQPTLWPRIDAQYWVDSGLLAPYDLSRSVTRQLTAFDYNPFDEFAFSAQIDATGGSLNRGWLTVVDVLRLLNQTEGNDREWRMQSLAGLHCPLYRTRNHLTSTGLGDVTNLPIPFQVQTRSSSASTGLTTTAFTTLGARQLYQRYSNTGMTLALGTHTGGYTAPLASWNPGVDSSHAPAWGYLPALLTGRRVFRDVASDSAFAAMYKQPGGCIKLQARETSVQGKAALGWPVRYWTPMGSDSQTRDQAWRLNVLVNGWRVSEDGSDLKAHLREIIDVQADAHGYRVQYIEAQALTNQRDRKFFFFYHVTNPQEWEGHFVVGALCRAAGMLPDSANLQTAADWIAARPLLLAGSSHPLRITTLWTQSLRTSSSLHSAGNDFAAGDYFGHMLGVNASDHTILDLFGGSGIRLYKDRGTPTVGDVVRFAYRNAGSDKPVELTIDTDYYIKEFVTSSQIRISATPGGAAISMTPTGGNFIMWLTAPQALLNETDVLDPALLMAPYDGGDDYYLIGRAALAWALRRPGAEVSAPELAAAEANIAAMETAFEGYWNNAGGVSWASFNPAWMLSMPAG